MFFLNFFFFFFKKKYKFCEKKLQSIVLSPHPNTPEKCGLFFFFFWRPETLFPTKEGEEGFVFLVKLN